MWSSSATSRTSRMSSRVRCALAACAGWGSISAIRDAVAEDDPDRGWDELRAVTGQIDTPRQRAHLADAIIQLRDQRV